MRNLRRRRLKCWITGLPAAVGDQEIILGEGETREADMTDRISDNAARSRYELDVDGKIVFANYRRVGSTLHIPYVEAPPSLRGTGAAGRLMRGVMETARAEGLKVVPICGYASAWIHRHHEYHDLLE
jgi:predicted GNAT family acetyltransferase